MAGFEAGYPEGSFLWIVNNIYFQYYSLLIFLVSAATMIGVSYATERAVGGADSGPDVRHRDARAEGARRARAGTSGTSSTPASCWR